MQVRELQDRDKVPWNDYVRRATHSNFFHLATWKDVLEQVFDSETHYLLAGNNGHVRGVLPLLRVKSVLSGHFLTSLPGGMCAEDEETAQALLDQAIQLVHSTGARYLILRDGQHKWSMPELQTNEDHVTFVIDLAPDLEQIRRGFKKRTRQLVNQAVKAGLEVTTGADRLDDFYPAYARAMRDIGTPTFGFEFFQSLVDRFPQDLTLQTLSLDQQVLGGGFVAPFKDTVFCTWAGVQREFYGLRPNHLLYWETIRYGNENGFRWVDLGRCKKDSGGFTFKKSWGGEPRPLYQQYYLNDIDEPPAIGQEMAEDAKYRAFVAIWQKLPLPVTEVMGPWLRKRMPFG